ncbi:hypothetical protein AB0941_25385 [Streptomyces sp. NPDC013433]|uniref:hypothetical protein n=1 Tax=Streptomyces sp. NPDC013433 TaxID=3155604 RepID=UPI003453AF4E
MDTDVVPAGTPAAKESGCFIGCAIALLLFLVLLAWGAWALDEFEKGLDGSGQLEQAGASGDKWDPLGPGATARYEDGLKVTVSPPRREPDGTYGLTVTYENDTDEEVSFGGTCETLEVREGEPVDDLVGHDLTWLNRRECDSAHARPLGVDETRGVPVRVEPSRRGVPVTVEVGWPYGTSRDAAYFRLDLG